MERFYSLMKEKERKTPHKLKINPKQEIHLQLRKIADFISESGEWTPLDVELSVLDALRASYQELGKGEITLTPMTDEDYERLKGSGVHNWKGYKIDSYSAEKDKMLTNDTTYFMFDSEAKKSVKDIETPMYYRKMDPSIKFFRGNYHYQLGYMILNQDLMHFYEENQKDFETNEVTKEDFIHYLDSLRRLKDKSKWRTFGMLRNVYQYPIRVNTSKRQYMYDQVVNYIQSTYDVVRQKTYERRLNDDAKRAKVYETKKNIRPEIQQTMKDTSLLEHFRYVEIDDEVDLAKFKHFEKEVTQLISYLPQTESKPELRLRKLGNHKALGLYFPGLNTIAVDFRSSKDTHVVGGAGVQSFIHEYGHYLDYNYGKDSLSLSKDFQPILKAYQEEIIKEDYQDIQTNTKYGLDYYTTPTEVFARAFELYSKEIGLQTSLMHEEVAYENSSPYRAFTSENKKQIISYFDSQFPEYRERLLDKENTKEKSDEKEWLIPYGRNLVLVKEHELEDFGDREELEKVKIADKEYSVITAKENGWEKNQFLVSAYGTPERTYTRVEHQPQANKEVYIVMQSDFDKKGILLSEKQRKEENIQLVASRRTKQLGHSLQTIFMPSDNASQHKVSEKLRAGESVVYLSPKNKDSIRLKSVIEKMQKSDFERE